MGRPDTASSTLLSREASNCSAGNVLSPLLGHWAVIAPTLLALTFFFVRGVDGPPDSAWYLVAGLNLAKGYGLVDTDGAAIVTRGPVFPGLIAAGFSVFGVSVQHALWVVRGFFVGSIALLSWFGARLSSPWGGFTVGLLALTAVRIQEWYAVILLDGVLSFLLLLTVALVFEAARRERSMAWYAAAGAALGAALLTKEVALVLLPLPFLVWVLINRGSRAHALGCGVYLLGVLVVIAPWVAHVVHATGSVGGLAGSGEQVISRAREGGGGWLEMSVQYLGMVGPYYRHYVADRFILAPLWVAGWLYVVAGLLTRPSAARAVLVASAFLFSPIALITAKNGLRAGQTLFLYQISCVAAGVLLNDAARWLERLIHRPGHPRLAYGFCATSLLLVALCPQLLIDAQFRTWVKGRRVGNSHGLALGPPERFARKGWLARHLERAAERIQEEVPPRAVIMSDWHWRTSLYFFSGGTRRFIQIPYVSTPWPSRTQGDLRLREGEKPIFIFPRRNTADDLDVSLLVFTESGVMAELEKWGARWVVVTPRRHFLGLFFDSHPAFSRRAVLSDGRIRLYEQTGALEFAPFGMRVGSNTARWLEAMRAERPKAAAEIERFLLDEVRLSAGDLEELKTGCFPQVSTSPGY